MCEKHITDDFILINGDTYFEINFLKLYKFFKSKETIGAIALKKLEYSNRYGSVLLEGEKIKSFKEKEDLSSKKDCIVNGGISIFSPDIFSF